MDIIFAPILKELKLIKEELKKEEVEITQGSAGEIDTDTATTKSGSHGGGLEKEGVKVVQLELEEEKRNSLQMINGRSGEHKPNEEEVSNLQNPEGGRVNGGGDFAYGFVGGGSGDFGGKYGVDGLSKYAGTLTLPWEPGGAPEFMKEKQGKVSLLGCCSGGGSGGPGVGDGVRGTGGDAIDFAVNYGVDVLIGDQEMLKERCHSKISKRGDFRDDVAGKDGGVVMSRRRKLEGGKSECCKIGEDVGCGTLARNLGGKRVCTRGERNSIGEVVFWQLLKRETISRSH